MGGGFIHLIQESRSMLSNVVATGPLADGYHIGKPSYGTSPSLQKVLLDSADILQSQRKSERGNIDWTCMGQ